MTHTEALAEKIIEAWNKKFTSPANSAVDYEQAQVAAQTVLAALASTPPTAEPVEDALAEIDIAERHNNAGCPQLAYETLRDFVLPPLLAEIRSLRTRLATAEQAGYARGIEDAAEICHKEGEYQGRLGNRIATQMQVDFYKAEALIRALPTTQQKEEPHA